MAQSKQVVAVHVWLDMPAARDRWVDQYYSMSEVDDDGEEVRCLCGSPSLGRVWNMATEWADEHGLPAVEFAEESGTETDRYSPSKAVDAP